jgi:hypothetical protein
MLLARLVTVRHGYEAEDDFPRTRKVAAVSKGWLTRLLAAISLRKWLS